MAYIAELKQQLKDHMASLYNEGYLDDQFKQLQLIQDHENSDFVAEVVALFFGNFQRIIRDINTTLVGAPRLQRALVVFLNHCRQQDIQGCFNSLPQVMNEYDLLKSKLETMFKLEKQIAGF